MKKILLLGASLMFIAVSCNNNTASQTELKTNLESDTEIYTPSPNLQPKITPLPQSQSPALEKSKTNCDSNYSGCVPIASDVDCLGGSGNGPAYVSGPIRVTGSDIYDLDRDGDGIACE